MKGFESLLFVEDSSFFHDFIRLQVVFVHPNRNVQVDWINYQIRNPYDIPNAVDDVPWSSPEVEMRELNPKVDIQNDHECNV
jgi:hypothetical protein